jgi:hypothetical protein
MWTGLDYVSELQPPTDIYFMFQMIYEYGEQRWNAVDRGKVRNSEKDLSQCHFAYQISLID